MHAWLGDDEAAALLAALEWPPERGVRIQHDRIAPARLTELVDGSFAPVPWNRFGFLIDPGAESLGARPLHEAGAYYLQDPSAMAAAAALAVQPGERVIDLAAAPGGKATALVADMAATRERGAAHDEGVLVANDVHPGRVAALARNLERVGARRAIVTQMAPSEWARLAPEAFDAVLLDAPCSGEGMFRKSDAARADWSLATVATCAARQDELLDAAAELMAPGGRLVYATCTFAAEENERAIAALLRRRPDLKAGRLTLDGASPGRPSDGDASALPADAVARLWPHRVRGDGHVVILLRRDAGGPMRADRIDVTGFERSRRARARRPRSGAERRANPDDELVTAWRRFAEATLHDAARSELEGTDAGDGDDAGRLVMQGGVLWRRAGPAAWADVPSLRPGLALGRLQGDRFVPAHALAQALWPGEARVRLDFPVGSPLARAWLTGDELEWSAALAFGARVEGDANAIARGGYLQVTVADCGLGWARRSGDRLRNLYPKGLRRR